MHWSRTYSDILINMWQFQFFIKLALSLLNKPQTQCFPALAAGSLLLRILQIKGITGLDPSWPSSKRSAGAAWQLSHSAGKWDDLGWDKRNFQCFWGSAGTVFPEGALPTENSHLQRIQSFFSCVATLPRDRHSSDTLKQQQQVYIHSELQTLQQKLRAESPEVLAEILGAKTGNWVSQVREIQSIEPTAFSL